MDIFCSLVVFGTTQTTLPDRINNNVTSTIKAIQPHLLKFNCLNSIKIVIFHCIGYWILDIAMRSNQKQKNINIWKWLFLCTSVIFCIHLVYSFWFSKSTTNKERASSNVPPFNYFLPMNPEQISFEQAVVQSLKNTGQSGHENKPFSGVVNGRAFLIYNNTGFIDSMISNLHKYRQSPIIKANALIKDFGPKKVSSLRFLHLPKAGKAFSVSMIHYCCALLDDVFVDVNMPPSHHVWKFDPSCRRCMAQPVTVNGDYFAFFPYIPSLDKNRAITLIREPISRMAFQIDHMRRLRSQMTTYGFNHDEAVLLGLILSGRIVDALKIIFKTDDALSMSASSFASFSNQYSSRFVSKVQECLPIINANSRNRSMAVFDACRFQLVALYPGLVGCQTKLIVGRNCFDHLPVTELDVKIAQQRLREEFLFTGVYDRWNESVTLLHQTIGGKMFVDELRLPLTNSKKEEQKVYAALQEGHIDDPYDNELYAFAQSLFEERWKQVNK